jgi:hypothetical protein
MPPDSLPFPFWLLIHRGECPWRPVAVQAGRAAAFSTHQLAGAFLARAANPDWEVRLVVRATMGVLAGGFRRQGVTGITLDPGAGGCVTFQLKEEQ